MRQGAADVAGSRRRQPVVGGVVLGRPVTVRVPASSANVGPGFDTLGLALGIVDHVIVEAFEASPGRSLAEIEVHGEGTAGVPRDESHLVLRMVRAGLAHAGAAQPGLRLCCHNEIPHGRGLGSSSAAIVAGLVAARELLADAQALDAATILDLASAAEGHPDNAAATMLGGFTVAWTQGWREGRSGTSGLRAAHAVRLEVDPRVRAVLCLAPDELATSRARAMLPTHVPHGDAAFNAGRAALLVEALTRRPELLLPATADRLHQDQRAAAMPQTLALVEAVRARGAAAVVSGAGPSVLVLGAGDGPIRTVNAVREVEPQFRGWQILTPDIDPIGCVAVPKVAPEAAPKVMEEGRIVTDGPERPGTGEPQAAL